MRIRIVHETSYRYERPAKSLVQVLRLTPRDFEGQHVLRWRIEPSVDGRLKPCEDALGNIVHMFSCDGSTDALVITVAGELETVETHGVVNGAVERLPDPFFRRETRLTAADGAIQKFARSAAGDRAADPLSTLHRLLEAVHRDVTFDMASTDVGTTAQQAFGLRRGVCQDLTHIFIAAARHLGIPARYVSGYFVRSDGVVDQAAGHAWAEARVPHVGWVGFDPANGISSGEAHVRVAIGLDYLGAAPIRGSRQGQGAETLDVKLHVASEGAGSQRQVQG